MPERDEDWIRAIAPAFRQALSGYAAGRLPANIAAMQLLMQARAPEDAEQAVMRLLQRLCERPERSETRPLETVLAVLRSNPGAWRTVRTVLDDVRHDEAPGDADAAVRRWAAAFDRAARASPEGSVALYALGNPELLKAATEEVVVWLRGRGLIGRERQVLDLGCGIGRFGAALAGQVGGYVGIDISGEMIAAARRRCAGLGGVSFAQTSGRDLSLFRDSAFDVVLAVDAFPYLVQSGTELAETHVAEAARVLKAGGDLLILNFSYRGDPAGDLADLRRLAGACGLALVRDGLQPFSLWDGAVYHLSKRKMSPSAPSAPEPSREGSVI
ncbi:MAG TPA: class I SAM-dependent methyltransferase [Beijerinckiaceae bacterium]|nr:class I SAM-dependent methyltransferase [Beijerinckiaceae bacterium]